LTPEELQKVELAYAETVRDIERRGKRLYIHSASERTAFIRRYQGSPNTTRVNEARDRMLPYYNIRTTPQEDIVALAGRESGDFHKVRMIHDWVSDVFSYDYDLLWWMDNVSGKNAEFTLGKIIDRQRGVCFEYAILFWFLMDAAGLETYLISDYSKPGVGHAYNMVVIDGTGYIIDTTWDSGNWFVDGRITRFDRMVSKSYFMSGVSQSYRLRGW
jgi:transglutaminase/protease-like cytokinesis protein 3